MTHAYAIYTHMTMHEAKETYRSAAIHYLNVVHVHGQDDAHVLAAFETMYAAQKSYYSLTDEPFFPLPYV